LFDGIEIAETDLLVPAPALDSAPTNSIERLNDGIERREMVGIFPK
jgi:hypothetical protein